MYYLLILFLFSGAALGMYNSYKKNSSSLDNRGKYLCVPCGYIYDPVLGDPDSGIAPGTEFADIPEDWSCPVCGVTKADFIPLGGEVQDTSFNCEIVGHTMMNQKQNVLELKLKAPKNFSVHAGQYFSVMYSDAEGDFRRSYSVAQVEQDTYTFLIRLGDSSRSANILRSKKIGDSMKIHGIYGNFLYQNTPNKKVFIATGTGLAPIYHMLTSYPRQDHILVFGVRDMADIFYLQELEKLEGIQAIYIYFSGEENMPTNRGKLHFIKGRFDVCSFLDTTPDYKNSETEFYLCGNPSLVDTCLENLEKLGYTRIFKEKF